MRHLRRLWGWLISPIGENEHPADALLKRAGAIVALIVPLVALLVWLGTVVGGGTTAAPPPTMSGGTSSTTDPPPTTIDATSSTTDPPPTTIAATSSTTDAPATTTTSTVAPPTAPGIVLTTGGVDFPGPMVNVGDTIDSVIDEATKPFEIFSIDLVAGQELKFKLTFRDGSGLFLVPPGSYDIDTFSGPRDGVTLHNQLAGTTDKIVTYTPATSGQYHVYVSTIKNNNTYTIEITNTG